MCIYIALIMGGPEWIRNSDAMIGYLIGGSFRAFGYVGVEYEL